ncbi:hypothetical protein ACHAAC_09640 [Aeromicrobium sp. CF4.19]|uniref:hypothetical protein n=1 Tax=Aeromicrobium sp. CF4.19 TaxID=3373082 RepID=UPI003EE74932
MTSTGDRFFDRLRELQPDVDLVVLPPIEPDERPVADQLTIETSAEATATTAADLLTAADLAATRTWDRWQRTREGLHTHRTRVRVERDDEEDAAAAFAAVGAAILQWGWQLRPIDAPKPWMVADGGRMHVDVAVERDHVVVTVTSAPLQLPGRPT